MAVNPRLFLEMASHSWVTVRTPIAEISLNFNVTPYKFTPIDFQFAWSLDSKSRYCSSAGYDQDVMDFTVNLEAKFNECYHGLFGWAIGDDASDCQWRRYYP